MITKMKSLAKLMGAAALAGSVATGAVADDSSGINVNLTTIFKSAHVFDNGFNYTKGTDADFDAVWQNALTVSGDVSDNVSCNATLFTSSYEDNSFNQLELVAQCGLNLGNGFSAYVGYDRGTREESPVQSFEDYQLGLRYKGEKLSADVLVVNDDVLGYDSYEIRPIVSVPFRIGDRPMNVNFIGSYQVGSGFFDSGLNALGVTINSPFEFGKVTVTPQIRHHNVFRDEFENTTSFELMISTDL